MLISYGVEVSYGLVEPYLSEAMACLPYEQREVITLRMQADMPLRQISRLHRCLLDTLDYQSTGGGSRV